MSKLISWCCDFDAHDFGWADLTGTVVVKIITYKIIIDYTIIYIWQEHIR